MFDDFGWLCDIERSQQKAFDRWFKSIHQADQNIVIIEIGAGVEIPSIRRLSESLSYHKNTRLIRINPRHCDAPSSAISIKARGLDGIQQILATVGT